MHYSGAPSPRHASLAQAHLLSTLTCEKIEEGTPEGASQLWYHEGDLNNRQGEKNKKGERWVPSPTHRAFLPSNVKTGLQYDICRVKRNELIPHSIVSHNKQTE